ncbi:beta-hexosaminidase [Burkholderia sp. 22PA0099]|uniref:beta-hexosaminidase n=1 Tax=Burkholderia sp. 22PA0099 TaxID=3237372 RepID=UPI0039C3DC78
MEITMPQFPTHALIDVKRRDTLSLHSATRYDPRADRPSTPILVGKYVVDRRPLSDSIYTLYSIRDGAAVARTQISIPSEADCASAIHARVAAINAKDDAGKVAKRRRQTSKVAV